MITKNLKYLPSTQESCGKFTAKCATATPCFIWETWLSLTLTRWEKIPIHPNSQAEAVSLATWYHSNEEQMVIQVQDIFLAAPFFHFLFFSKESVKKSVSLRKKKKKKTIRTTKVKIFERKTTWHSSWVSIRSLAFESKFCFDFQSRLK